MTRPDPLPALSQTAGAFIAATALPSGRGRGDAVARRATLARLRGRVLGAIDRVDPFGLDADGIAILTRWYDALMGLRRPLDEWSAHTGCAPNPLTRWREDARGQVSRGGLHTLLQDGSHVIAPIGEALDLLSEERACAALRMHRRILARVKDAAQARLDL